MTDPDPLLPKPSKNITRQLIEEDCGWVLNIVRLYPGICLWGNFTDSERIAFIQAKFGCTNEQSKDIGELFDNILSVWHEYKWIASRAVLKPSAIAVLRNVEDKVYKLNSDKLNEYIEKILMA